MQNHIMIYKQNSDVKTQCYMQIQSLTICKPILLNLNPSLFQR
jgi:hypothetical protein